MFGVVTETGFAPATPPGTRWAGSRTRGAALLRPPSTVSPTVVDGGTQPAEGISLAPKVSVEQARIRWDLPAHVIERRIRSVTLGPGAWTMIGEQRTKVGPVIIDPTGDALDPVFIEVERSGCGSVPGAGPVLP